MKTTDMLWSPLLCVHSKVTLLQKPWHRMGETSRNHECTWHSKSVPESASTRVNVEIVLV